MILALISIMNDYKSYENAEFYDQKYLEYQKQKMPELHFLEQYSSLSAPDNTVLVFPILTQSAYGWGGIHDYYSGYCDNTCLTVKIDEGYKMNYSVGGNGYRILEFLGYTVIDDIELDLNPNILENFDKIILLHNEYITKNEFNAITNHPNVIYLYPNSLYAEVEINYNNNTMTLVRGNQFPESNIKTGFDWADDNTQYFEDNLCDTWNFYKISNGYMLNCYPEYLILKNSTLLKQIKEL